MRSKRKLLLISLLIVLSLALITACSTDNPAPASVEGPKEVTQAKEPNKQTIDQPKEEPKSQHEEKAPSETPAEAPAETKTTESQKPANELPESTKEPSKPKQADTVSLIIEGSGIDEPTVLTLDELKAMTDAYYEDDYFSLNSYGTKEYFSFKGIRLGAVLEKAGIKESAEGLTFIASDGYKFELSLEQALKDDYIDEQNPDKKYPVIIAWHENGQDYNASKGAPFRLVIGQKEPGDVNKPQWVQNIAKIIVN
jgi:DMSO/TMAO reductase YedYZ molybdopterin-dependent catalytic subunit